MPRTNQPPPDPQPDPNKQQQQAAQILGAAAIAGAAGSLLFDRDQTLPSFTPQSSNVEYVQYNPKSLELTIEYKYSGVYVYANVPPRVYYAFAAAPSAGKFVHQQIKDRYSFTQTGFSSR